MRNLGIVIVMLSAVFYFYNSATTDTSDLSFYSMYIIWAGGVYSIMHMVGARAFTQRHTKVRQELASILDIPPILHRNFFISMVLITGFVIGISLGVFYFMQGITPNLYRQMGLAVLLISIWGNLPVWLMRTFYFYETDRPQVPFYTYLYIPVWWTLVVLAQTVHWTGFFVVYTLPFVMMLGHRVLLNRQYMKFLHDVNISACLELLETKQPLGTYLFPQSQLYIQAVINYHLGQFDEAKTCAYQILEAKIGINMKLMLYQQAINLLGLIAMEVGAYATARSYLETSLRLSAHEAIIYDSLGEVYLREGEFPDYALKFFDTAISEATDSKEAWRKVSIPLHLAGRAWALAMLGRSSDVDSTIATIEADFKQNTLALVEFQYRLGCARLAQSKTDLAFEHFKQVDDLDKQSIIGQHAREMLVQLEDTSQ